MKYILIYLISSNLLVPVDVKFNSKEECRGAKKYIEKIAESNHINHGTIKCIEIEE
jgi:hypothetical protein